MEAETAEKPIRDAYAAGYGAHGAGQPLSAYRGCYGNFDRDEDRMLWEMGWREAQDDDDRNKP